MLAVFDDCRYANATFPQVVFTPAQTVGFPGQVQLVYLTRFTRDRAVVAGKDDDGVIFLAHRLNFIQHFTDLLIHVADIGVIFAGAAPRFVCPVAVEQIRMLLLVVGHVLRIHIKVFFRRRQRAMDFGKGDI
ncbi:Uncharacterised protein [Salmonella enterica subsp. enterica serovar Bovismorbificans]|uniref:Uncharacterized protein n=1 Tax=Salmonella enterica subsp. enterica serovar Bovismorbificans TaxID=58097 RepID=A0A655DCL5_SALET|nr:Uncharacterised protein [Salmonella enterica subsp. enterica serovar Bovismorbificans]CNV06737.1 Uncharacterised protein [Salmonella enterica subsp. enterica serovar Bovismorbificans]